jgi:hypothetical protein
MLQPFMGYNHFGMASELALDTTCFPIPENHVALCISARDPLSIRGETDLASVSCNGVASKPLFPVLSEIVGVVEQDLIIQ